MVTKPCRYVEIDIRVMNGMNAPQRAYGVKCEVRSIANKVKYQDSGEKTNRPRKEAGNPRCPWALLHRESERHTRQRKHNKRQPNRQEEERHVGTNPGRQATADGASGNKYLPK